MSRRPEARASQLAGMSAITTAPAPVPAPAVVPPAEPAAPPARRPKATFRIPEDTLGRARAAYWHTAHVTGMRSLNEWVVAAIEEKLVRDEREYNAGQPFEDIPPHVIPTGSPLR